MKRRYVQREPAQRLGLTVPSFFSSFLLLCFFRTPRTSGLAFRRAAIRKSLFPECFGLKINPEQIAT